MLGGKNEKTTLRPREDSLLIKQGESDGQYNLVYKAIS